MSDSSVSLSVTVLGEARQLLSALRRNRRFGYLLSFASTSQPPEHPLVKEVKSLRDVLRIPVTNAVPSQINPLCADGSLIPRDALINALEPFFQVVRSRDASGIITGVALKSLDTISAHLIALANQKQVLPQYATALSAIIEAAAACRFDATDPASDEVVLARITGVITTVICSPALQLLPDASILRSIEACLGIASGRRRASILLKSTADAGLVNICAAIGHQLHTIVSQHQNVQPTDIPSIFAHGVSGPAFGYAFDTDSFQQHGPASIAMVAALIQLCSRMADPLYAQSLPERILGLELLSSFLSAAGAKLKSHPVLKRLLLRDCCRGILRTLGVFQSQPAIIASAFTIATQLVHALHEDTSPFLFALLDRVFPYYISGFENVLPSKSEAGKPSVPDEIAKAVTVTNTSQSAVGSNSLTPAAVEIDPVIREIGLESLAALLSTPGLLCVMFRLADCEMRRTDLVRPLVQALGHASKTKRFRRRSKRLRASSSGTHRLSDATAEPESDDDDVILSLGDGNSDSTRFSRACSLLCAEAVLAIIDTISDRLKLETAGLAVAPLMDYEAQKLGRKVQKEKKRMQKAGAQFNSSEKINKARKLVPILCEHGFIASSPKSDGNVNEDLDDEIKAIVQFLKNTPDLNKEKIGVILGEPDSLSRRVLADYTAAFEFSGRPFTESLRVFLESFRLPGEAQKIDRILQSFANRYYAQSLTSPDARVLKSADAAHVLSYSVVMLNTDQHNDSIRKKMTLDDFVKNCRGLNDKEDFPKWFLVEVYNSIIEIEIRMSDEAGIGALTDLLWDEQLRRMEGERTAIPNAQSSRVFDEDLFHLSWEAGVVAANSILNEAGDANSVQKALEGFLSVARCATSFRIARPTDAVVSSLCTATTLREGPLQGAAVRFGTDIKAQMASVALSGVSRQCGDWLQAGGWEALVNYLLRLHALCLLPTDLEKRLGGYGPELVNSTKDEQLQSQLIPAWWPSQSRKADQVVEEEKPKRTLRANGFFAAILAASIGSEVDSEEEEYDPHNTKSSQRGGGHRKVSHVAPSYMRMKTREDTEAMDLARKCIAGCRVEDVVINEAKVLQSSALKHLSEAIAGSAVRLMTAKQDGPDETETLKSFGRAENNESVLDWTDIAPPSPKRDASIIAGVTPRPFVRISAESESDYSSFGRSQSWEGALRERDENKARELVIAFCVDILCELTFQNRDRLNIPWPSLHSLLVRVIAPATHPSAVLERSVTALLRVGVRLLHREDVRDDVLRGLNLLVLLPADTAEVLSLPISIGVQNMVQAHGSIIRATSGWHAILSILEGTAQYQSKAREVGFSTLRFLLRGPHSAQVVASETFAPLLDAILAFTSTSSVDISIQALELLYLLAQRIPSFRPVSCVGVNEDSNLKKTTSSESVNGTKSQDDQMWSEFWSPLFLGFAASVRDPRGKVRNCALSVLERVVALGGSGEFLSASQWNQALLTVILPLMTQLFTSHGFLTATVDAERAAQKKLLAERKAASSSGRGRPRSFAASAEHDEQLLRSVIAACNKTRMRAIILTSKTFLQHHAVIASGLPEESFTELWVAVLEVFRVAFECSSKPSKDALAIKSEINTPEHDEVLEHIPESVKNLLLVLCDCGLLAKNREVRWNATFTMVRNIVIDVEDIISATQAPLTNERKSNLPPSTVNESFAIEKSQSMQSEDSTSAIGQEVVPENTAVGSQVPVPLKS